MMNRRLLVFALFAFFSVSYSACLENVQSIIFSNAGQYIAMAFALMVLVIAFTYMFGKLLGKTEYTVFSKDELFHLGVSALLIVLAGLVISLACTVSSYFITSALTINYAATGGASDTCLSAYIIDENATSMTDCFLIKVEQDAKNLLKTSIKSEIDQQMWSSWAMTIYFPFMGGVTTPKAAYKKAAAMEHGMIYNTFVVPSLISISMQRLLVHFLSESAITFFLPAGIFFRIIPPFRQIGNLLIVLAIGLYIILPLAYAFNAATYNLVFQKAQCIGYSGIISDFVQGECDSISSFWSIARIIPQAFFLPNLTLALFITYLSAANKALRVIG